MAFVCGVFGENQSSGWLAGGSERHADEAPVRCDGGKEQIVASVFTDDRGSALVGFGGTISAERRIYTTVFSPRGTFNAQCSWSSLLILLALP